MFNQIFLLYSCNEWKEWASMRLIMATTVQETLDGAIVKELDANKMGFAGLCGEEAATAFQNRKRYDDLSYGYVGIVGDGEWQ